MRIVIAGAHGQIARRLGRMLSDRGDTVLGIVRNPDHRPDLESDGVQPVVLDLEQATVEDVTAVVSGADAVVFAAGGGPNSGAARKDSVDRGAAVLLADAAVAAGVRPYLLVSSIGVEQVADGRTPEGMDEVFVAYLRAKLAAEQHVLSAPGLTPTVLRPGGLTDEPGTGRVRLERTSDRGQVSRDDVAAVLLALLDSPKDGTVVELLAGDTPVTEAVAALP
ncbi:NAD(P)H-binding protein [Modestobacter lacusdianchii]